MKEAARTATASMVSSRGLCLESYLSSFQAFSALQTMSSDAQHPLESFARLLSRLIRRMRSALCQVQEPDHHRPGPFPNSVDCTRSAPLDGRRREPSGSTEIVRLNGRSF